MFGAIADFLQTLIDVIGLLIKALLLLFPPSPFKILYVGEYADLIAKINYFLPINEMVAITEAWIVAIGVYYAYSVYARFVKAID